MDLFLCTTCGNAYPVQGRLPEICTICADDRQYVLPTGQRWIRSDQLAGQHAYKIIEPEPDLYRIEVDPTFGIGHRPTLVRTEGGNLLWEPSGYLDASLLQAVADLGGVAAVSASHPHLVGQAVAWADEFEAPLYCNADDRRWFTHVSPRIQWWRDRQEVLPGITLVQAGGHFPGSSVVHWSAGADGRGALLSGDTIAVMPSRTVSFMRSYPNAIPLSERLVRSVVAAVEPYEFDRIYGAFTLDIDSGAKRIVAESAERYIGWITDRIHDPDERSAT